MTLFHTSYHLSWSGYALYSYFEIMQFKFCLRVIPKLTKRSKDRRIIALWRVK